MNILHRHAFKLVRHCLPDFLGIEPEVNAGHPRHPVNGFALNNGQ